MIKDITLLNMLRHLQSVHWSRGLDWRKVSTGRLARFTDWGLLARIRRNGR